MIEIESGTYWLDLSIDDATGDYIVSYHTFYSTYEGRGSNIEHALGECADAVRHGCRSWNCDTGKYWVKEEYGREDDCRWIPSGQHDKDADGNIIVCEHDECDWWGTAYASQFALHESRRHGDTDE